MGAMDPGHSVALGAGGCCCCCLVLLLIFSFSQLEPTNVALKYNYVLQTIDPTPVTQSSLYFLGPFTKFIRFPSTIQTINVHADDPTYNNPKELLDGRTHDGLPLMLGVAFQYSLDTTKVYDLYRNYGEHYDHVFYLKGVHIIAEVATQFNAYKFFDDKITITNTMRKQMSDYFSEHLYSRVTSLQINEDSLPDAFSEAVSTAQTTRNKKQQKLNEKTRSQVQFDTDVIVAQKTRDATVNEARGTAQAILEQAKANAAIITAYTDAEIGAYTLMKNTTGLNGDTLLDYIWYDILGSGGVGSEATASSSTNADRTIFVGGGK